MWTVVDGFKIHACASMHPSAAEVPKVVLVHGIGVSGRYMIPTAAALRPHCAVYIPDLPGFGKSAKPRQVLDVRELGDVLAAWQRTAGVGRATLVANSFGCQVVVDAALRHADLIDRLVLNGPTMDPAARGPARQLLRWARDVPREPLSLVPVVADDYVRCGPRRIVATFRAALRDEIEANLPRVAVPILIVRGERDPIVPQPWAERAAELSGGRLAVVPEAGHAVNYSAPEQLAELVRAFIQDG